MAKYMICVCGWISEEYPDNYMFMGLGGVLNCPICHAQQRNATLEMCYGHISVVTSKELQLIREFEARDIPWEKAISLYHEVKIWKQYPVTYNKELEDYLNSPREGPIHCPRCDSTNIGIDSDDNHLCNECGYHFDDDELLEPDPFEEKEDNIRKSSQKSIRKGGKYKERGKEKRREP